MPSRTIEIYGIEPNAYENGVLDVGIACSKGTYVRSLARDIARASGTFGSLETLDRIRVGNIKKNQCVSHIDFEKNPTAYLKDGQDISELLFEFPFLFLLPKYQADFLSGKTISESWFDNTKDTMQNGTFLVFLGKERIAGVIEKTDMTYSYQCVFSDL